MAQPKPEGIRAHVMAMRRVSELLEKHPEMDESPVYTGDLNKLTIKFHVWARSWLGDEGDQRREVEGRISALLDALGPGIEWVKNEPTGAFGSAYYQLTAAVEDRAEIVIVADRAVLCERVVVLEDDVEEEVPDPELLAKLTAAVPMVKVISKKETVEWQCNPVIAEKTQLLTAPA